MHTCEGPAWPAYRFDISMFACKKLLSWWEGLLILQDAVCMSVTSDVHLSLLFFPDNPSSKEVQESATFARSSQCPAM